MRNYPHKLPKWPQKANVLRRFKKHSRLLAELSDLCDEHNLYDLMEKTMNLQSELENFAITWNLKKSGDPTYMKRREQ